MGLDVYAGGFTRFYTNDYETPVQRVMAGQGIPANVVRTGRPKWMDNPKKVQAEVHRWKRSITSELRRNVKLDVDWDEHDAPYCNEQLMWHGYGALLLWAAYNEHPEMMPSSINIESWGEDPAYQRATQNPRAARYSQLYDPASIWLPGGGNDVFILPTVEGKETVAGFTQALLAQLSQLNDRTWKAELHQVTDHDTEEMTSFEASAWICFCRLHKVTQWAVANGMPMQLDG